MICWTDLLVKTPAGNGERHVPVGEVRDVKVSSNGLHTISFTDLGGVGCDSHHNATRGGSKTPKALRQLALLTGQFKKSAFL
jgi:hypothetical protein